MAKKTLGNYFVIKRDKKEKPASKPAPKGNFIAVASNALKDYSEQLISSGIISKPADLAKFKPTVSNENRFICEIRFYDSKSNDRYILITIGKNSSDVLNSSVHFEGITKPIGAASKPKKK